MKHPYFVVCFYIFWMMAICTALSAKQTHPLTVPVDQKVKIITSDPATGKVLKQEKTIPLLYRSAIGINSGLSGDDSAVNGLPIGFTFNYWGQDYSTFGISSNGNINVAKNTVVENYNYAMPYPSTFSLDGIIAPYFDNLTFGSNSAIYYLTTGEAPNRKLTIEFSNMYFYDYYNNIQLLGNFAVSLYETSNKIEFLYHDIYNYYGYSATIGIDAPNSDSNYCLVSHNSWGSIDQNQKITLSPEGNNYTITKENSTDWYNLANIIFAPVDSPSCTNQNTIHYSWNHVVGATNYQLTVYDNTESRQIVDAIAVGDTTEYSYTGSLVNDVYYTANVGVSFDGGSIYSLISPISAGVYVDRTAPNVGNLNFNYWDNEEWRSLEISMNGTDNYILSNYFLQIATDSLFNNVIIDTTLDYGMMQWRNPPRGLTLFGRYRVVDMAGNISDYSTVKRYDIPSCSPPSTIGYYTKTDSLFYYWEAFEGAVSYRIDIATNIFQGGADAPHRINGSEYQIIYSTTTTNNSFTYSEPLTEGTYYYARISPSLDGVNFLNPSSYSNSIMSDKSAPIVQTPSFSVYPDTRIIRFFYNSYDNYSYVEKIHFQIATDTLFTSNVTEDDSYNSYYDFTPAGSSIYYSRFVAYDPAGNMSEYSPFSAPAQLTMPTPYRPENTERYTNIDSLSYNWYAINGANSYRIQIATYREESYVIATEVVGNVTSYTYRGALTNNTSYFARISASGDDGNTWSNWSDFSSYGIYADFTAPSAPNIYPYNNGHACLYIYLAEPESDNTGIATFQVDISPDTTFNVVETHLVTTGYYAQDGSFYYYGMPLQPVYIRAKAIDKANNSSPYYTMSTLTNVPALNAPWPAYYYTHSDSVRFAWSSHPKATKYRIQISTSQDTTGIVYTSPALPVTSTSMSWYGSLTNNTHYYASMAFSADDGVTFSAPSPFSYSGVYVDKDVPITNKPVISQGNNAYVYFYFPTNDNSYIQSYHYQVATDTLFTSPISDVTNSSGSLYYYGIPGETFYVRFTATDAAGNTSAYSVCSDAFTIPPMSAPYMPEYTKANSNTVSISWNSVGCANLYKLEIARTLTSTIIDTIYTTSSSYNLTRDFVDGEVYYACVSPSRDNGAHYGNPSDFSVACHIDRTAPTVQKPVITSVTSDYIAYQITGNDNNSIYYFYIQAATDTAFTHITYESTRYSYSNQTTYYAYIPQGTGIYVRAYASDNAGNSGAYSPISDLAYTAPAAPPLIYPVNLQNIEQPVRLSWHSSPFATSYHLMAYYYPSNAYSYITIDSTGITDTTLTLPILRPDSYCYWQIAAVRGNTTGSYSSNVYFQTASHPDIATVTDTLIFNNFYAGQSKSRVINIQNVGTDPLHISNIYVLPNYSSYSIGYSYSTIQPNGSLDVTVQRWANNAGDFADTLFIASDDDDEPIYKVRLFSHVMSPPAIAVSPDTLDFGRILVGTDQTKTFTITNTGEADMIINSLYISNGYFSFADEQSFSSSRSRERSIAFPFTIASGQSREITVKFAPTYIGNQTGYVYIYGNIPTATIALSGYGYEPANATIDAVTFDSPVGYLPGAQAKLTQRFSTTASMQSIRVNTKLTNGANEYLNENIERTINHWGYNQYYQNVVVPQNIPSGNYSFFTSIYDVYSNTILDTLTTAVAIGTPTVNISTNNIAFPIIQVGKDSTVTFSVQNTGTLGLTIQPRNLNSPFSNSTIPTIIAVGASETISVKFDPITNGNFSDTLSLVTNNGTYLVHVSGSSVKSILSVQPSVISDTVLVGNALQKEFLVQNLGDGPLTYQLTGNLNSSWYSFDAPTAGTLLPNSSNLLIVHYLNTVEPGHYTQNLYLVTNDPQHSSTLLQMNLYVYGPKMALSKSAYTIVTGIGGTDVDTLVISNTGITPLHFTISDNAAWLFLNPSQPSYTLNPGQHKSFELQLDAGTLAPATYNASITLNCDDPDRANLNIPVNYTISGTALTILPSVLNFGDVVIGDTLTKNVTLKNTGNLPLTIQSIGAMQYFTVPTVLDTLLTPGNSIIVPVTFTTSNTLVYQETMIINTDADVFTLDVNAAGVLPSPAWTFSWDSHFFGYVDYNHTATYPVSIYNSGNTPLRITGWESTNSHFSATESAFTIPVQQTHVVNIAFDPDSIQYYSTQLHFLSNAAPIILSLSGNGIYQTTPPELRYLSVLPFNSNSGVSPNVGPSATLFEYRVAYYDADNDEPMIGYPQLGIDVNGDHDYLDPQEGSIHMQEVDPSDHDYTNGKIYSFMRTVPIGQDPGYAFKAFDKYGNPATGAAINYHEGPLVSNDLLDLAIYANDITFSDGTPSVGQEITINATVRNNSDYPATNVSVSFYEEDTFIQEQVINELRPQSQTTLTITRVFPIDQFYPIKVVIDEQNTILEDNELNNFAIRPVVVGNYQLPGSIIATANISPAVANPMQYMRYSGRADYHGTNDPNLNVSGAQITMTILETNQIVLSHTLSDGTFSIDFAAPQTEGLYHITSEITDFTFTALADTVSFRVVVPHGPDLYVSPFYSFATWPHCTIQGEDLPVSLYFSNIGNEPAYNVKVRFATDESHEQLYLIPAVLAGQSITLQDTVSFSTVGYHNYSLFVDYNNDIAELSEYNNYKQESIFIYPNIPDYQVTGIWVDDYSPLSGQALSCSFNISNFGKRSHVSSNAKIYDAYGGVETLLANVPIDSMLCISSLSYFTRNLHLYGAGWHELRIKADDPSIIQEYSENNNIGTLNINVRSAISDLSVTNAYASNSQVHNGDEVNFVSHIVNYGNAAALNFWVKFYVADTCIDSTLVTRLDSYSNRNVVSRPWTVNTDPKELKVVVDASNVVYESNEYNNSYTRSLGYDLSPDLYPYFYNNYIRIPKQTTLDIYCRVLNYGTWDTDSVSVAFVDETHSEFFGHDVVPYVHANSGSNTAHMRHEFNDLGSHAIYIYADRHYPNGGDYNEIVETNNVTVLYVDVYDRLPDLAVYSEYISPTELNPDENEPVSIYSSFKNNGDVDAGPFWVKFLVNSQAIGDSVFVPNLAAHEDSTVAATTTFSSNIFGAHVIRVRLDDNNQVPEYDEMNNEASRAIIVGDAPDLVFSKRNGIQIAEGSPVAGNAVQVKSIIRNQGGARVNAVANFYSVNAQDSTLILSTNFTIAAKDSLAINFPWTVSQSFGKLSGTIVTANPQEYNEFNNYTRFQYGSSILVPTHLNDLTINEDADFTSLGDLDPVFTNVDMTSLSYNVTCNPNKIQTKILANNELQVKPEANWYGSASLIIEASNIYGLTASDTVLVTVLPVNDAPTVNMPDTLTTQEDTPLVVDLRTYVQDIDNTIDQLAINVTSSTHIQASISGSNLNLAPATNWNGYETLNISINDTPASGVSAKKRTSRASTSTSFIVSVLPVNDVPVLKSHIPDVVINEDSLGYALDLTPYFADADSVNGDTLTYSVTSAQHLTLNIVERKLHVTPEVNWFGNANVTITATDLSNTFVSDDIQITVSSVNDLPVINLPSTVYLNEDTTYSIRLSNYISDVDNSFDQLSISYANNNHTSCVRNGADLIISPETNWSGIDTMLVIVSDQPSYGIMKSNAISRNISRSSNEPVQQAIRIIVNPVNDTPSLIASIPDIVMDEDTQYNCLQLFNCFTDVDLPYGDSLSYSASAHSNLSVSIANGQVTIAPIANYYGTETVTFTATDIAQTSVTDTIIVTINNVNDAPTIDIPATFSVVEDTPATYDFASYITDIDNTIAQMTLTAQSTEHIAISITGTQVTFTPAANWNGTESATFTVNDNAGGVRSMTLKASGSRAVAEDGTSITVTGVNDVPRLAAIAHIPDIVMNEDTQDNSINLNTFFTDADLAYGDQLTYTSNFSNNLTVGIQNGQVTIAPIANYYGTETVTFTATDIAQTSVTDTIIVTINNVNDAPTIDIPATFSVVEDTPATYDFASYITDIDNTIAQMTLTAQSTEHIAISITGTQVTFTPAANWNGTESTTFLVNDNAGGVRSMTLKASGSRAVAEDGTSITVTGVNDVPRLAAIAHIPDIVMNEDTQDNSINLNTFFTDADLAYGDQLTYTSNFSNNLTVGIQNGQVTITPIANYYGTETVTFTATDIAQTSVTDTIIVTINNVNDAPTIDIPATFSVVEDTPATYDFASYITDIDNTIAQMTLTAQSTEHIAISITGTQVTFTPAANWNGTESATFLVNDNAGGVRSMTLKASGSRAVAEDGTSITVTGVNDVPRLAAIAHIPDIVMNEDTQDNSINLNTFFTDADLAYGDQLTYTSNFSNNLTVGIQNGQVTIAPIANYYGTETVTFTATDIAQTSVTDTIIVTINNVNDAPTIDIPATFSVVEDTPATYDFASYITDIDNTIAQMTLTAQSTEHIAISITGTQVTFTPAANWNGTESATFLVNDNAGGVRSMTLKASGSRAVAEDGTSITVTGVNDVPTLVSPIADITVNEDVVDYTVNVANNFTDTDLPYGDQLTYSITTAEHLTLSIANGILHITPEANWFGSANALITATDNLQASVSDEILITVYSVNDAPVINLPETFTTNEDTPLVVDFTPYLADIDNNVAQLSLTVAQVPNVVVTIEGHQVTFTPTQNWNGLVAITFTVDDNINVARGISVQKKTSRTTANDVVNFVVNSINDAPAINLPASITFNEDTPFNMDFTPFINDVDNTQLTLTASTPQHMALTINGYNISLQPNQNWFGSESIVFTVNDMQNRAIALDTLLVNIQSVNDIPVIHETTPSDSIFIQSANSVLFSINCTDIETTNLLYSWTVNNIAQTAQTDTFRYEFDAAGTFHVQVTISDGIAQVQKVWTVTVATDANDPTTPKVTELAQNYPNPFNPSTIIRYTVKEKGLVNINIFNSKGQRVRTLLNSVINPGSYQISWDGKDNNNGSLSSGMYFIRMDANQYHRVQKAILLK